MTRHKISKTSSYFSRFQVQYRRRREGKTDFKARIRLLTQDKNKYRTQKYRLVVRFSNRDITCQIAYATIAGDKMVCSAYAHELSSYGLKVGQTNYSSAYCVGLLCALRSRSALGLEKTHSSAEMTNKALGAESTDKELRPFTVVLDRGLKRTSTGSKVFAALKGAQDGNINLPHSEKRYVGYDSITKKYDQEVFKKYIYGGHVSEYLAEIKEEEPETLKTRFTKYVQHKIEPDHIEDILMKVHDAIREDPTTLPWRLARARYISSRTSRLGSNRCVKRNTQKKNIEDRRSDLMKKLLRLLPESNSC